MSEYISARNSRTALAAARAALRRQLAHRSAPRPARSGHADHAPKSAQDGALPCGAASFAYDERRATDGLRGSDDSATLVIHDPALEMVGWVTRDEGERSVAPDLKVSGALTG